MKQALHSLIVTALTQLHAQGTLTSVDTAAIKIELPRDKSHGDLATNVAMILAKPNAMNPRALAESLIAALPATNWLISAEIAGPGFINFRVQSSAKFQVIRTILESRDKYGRTNIGKGKSINVEYVSANPTGPLHVGHGRGAAYGSALVSLLRYVGYDVQSEYYVNDAGRQMDILTVSTWLRYLMIRKVHSIRSMPKNAYQGDYLISTARRLAAKYTTDFIYNGVDSLFESLPPDELIDSDGNVQGDKDAHIDALILKAKEFLGSKNYNIIFEAILNDVLSDIKSDLVGESDEVLWSKFRALANVKSTLQFSDEFSSGQQKAFGAYFDNFFHEKTLMEDGSIDHVLNILDEKGHLYQQNGATWFRSTSFGDDKDRVVVRENGIKTYFASDIAYHYDKLSRGYDQIINIWGSDHHGYIARVRAAMKALGLNDEMLKILLVQFAVLYRGGEQISMSTRSGQFVTLRELREEIGNDATRFFYLMRSCDQHMDFDLDLAKSESNDNPLFYIQYAHARCHSVFKKLKVDGNYWNKFNGLNELECSLEESEVSLAQKLSMFPEVVASAAKDFEPYRVTYYLREVAQLLHSYYNSTTILVDNETLRNARLTLLAATRVVLANGLTLLGVSAPERM
jgi:arginyl-tRNA synthetase